MIELYKTLLNNKPIDLTDDHLTKINTSINKSPTIAVSIMHTHFLRINNLKSCSLLKIPWITAVKLSDVDYELSVDLKLLPEELLNILYTFSITNFNEEFMF